MAMLLQHTNNVSVLFLQQILQATPLENWRECPLHSQRPSLDVRNGPPSLHPLYNTVPEGWIR